MLMARSTGQIAPHMSFSEPVRSNRLRKARPRLLRRRGWSILAVVLFSRARVFILIAESKSAINLVVSNRCRRVMLKFVKDDPI